MKKLQLIPINNTRLKESLLERYAKLVPEVIIPYQWEILNDRIEEAEKSYCIANFKIAAGKKQGEYGGAVFQDTDVAKWLEAVACSLAVTPQKELEELADGVIELLGEAQGEDGYLDTYYLIKEPEKRWTNLMEGHELYTAGHLIEAGVAYYKATGKRKLLHIVSRFADLIAQVFSVEPLKKGYPGHPEIELALIRLYEVTQDRRYLELAKQFVERRGEGENYFQQEEKKQGFYHIFPEFRGYQPEYSQSHRLVRTQKTAEGHAVRAVYLYCAMADLAHEYEDEDLLQTCKELWENIVNKRMYLTGSIGSSGLLERFTTDYDLPNERNYSETCASIGLMLFARRMAQITRDSKYIDVIERVIYNTLLASIGEDGKSFFYVNPLEVWPQNCMEKTSLEHVKPVRQKWFGVACCPPNIARTLASLGEYIYFVGEEGVYINLFIPSTTVTNYHNGEVKITIDTKFPLENKVNIQVENDTTGEVPLYVRIPTYFKNIEVRKNENIKENSSRIRGYEVIILGRGVTTIELIGEVLPRFIYANPEVRADNGKVAIQVGPMVYCLEQVDNGSNLSALYINTNKKPKLIQQEDISIPLVQLDGKRRKSWSPDSLYEEVIPEYEEVELIAVPYAMWGNRTPGEMQVWSKHCT